MAPQIREFRTRMSIPLTTKLLHAKRQDGQPAFNFMDLRRLSIDFDPSEEHNIRFLLRNTKSLERLYLSVGFDQSLMGLCDILSSHASTLKVLDLTTVPIYDVHQPLAGLCEALEAMTGRYKLETLSFEVLVEYGRETLDSIGPIIQKVEKVLVKPGWSALRQVSIKIAIASFAGNGRTLYEALQSLPDRYLSHLSKLESVDFDYLVHAYKGSYRTMF